MTKQPKGLKPGIYFDLPIEDYHNDPALSKSGIVDLMESEIDYWSRSPLNPNRHEDKNTTLDFGKMVHMRLLEPEKFDEHYFVMGNASWGDTRKSVSRTDYNDSTRAINNVHSVEYSRSLVTGGYPEVSIFWRDDESGLMFKMRPDYLKTFVASDYKTIKSIAESTITYQLSDYGYGIQSSMGIVGMRTAKQLLREKKPFVVQGNKEQCAWVKKAFMHEDLSIFRFIFQRSSFPFKCRHLSDDVANTAWNIVRIACGKYKNMIETTGIESPPPGENCSKEITLYEMPKKFSTMAEE